jgi:hypothetical protein
MKQELLEHLIRQCIREVITQVREVSNPQKQISISYGGVIFQCVLNVHQSEYSPEDWDILSVSVNGNEVTNNPSVKQVVDGFMSNEGVFGKTSQDREYNSQVWQTQFINGVNEADDEFKGAAAPPADGQGTADQPAIPQKNPTQEPPSAPETPEAPPAPDMKGVVFVNPKDKAKLIKVPIQAQDDAGIERSLHQQAARLAGSRVKVALSTSRMVKDILRNPNTTVYLYLGKYDPESDEIFLMADKSLQIAKDSSVSSGELTGAPITNLAPSIFNPLTAEPGEYAHQLSSQGKVPSTSIDENLQKIIKKIVNEILDNR